MVDSNDTPIGICSDCMPVDNVYTFGGCSSTLKDGDHKRTPVTAWNGETHMVCEKCIPMLDRSWKKANPGKDLNVWDYKANDYCEVITTGGYLVCYYGGLIEVAEVNNVNNGANRQIAYSDENLFWS